MAFKDMTVVLYDGKVKIDYKDRAHRYYARLRENWDLPEENPKAWGKVKYPKGTTTLLGDTLEKKGLMTWPMGMALKELFGFYDFKGDAGSQMTGFSKKDGGGTLWDENDCIRPLSKDDALPVILSASKNWTRRQKKGADIGSYVHNKIEEFVKNTPEQPLEKAGLVVAGENMRLTIEEYQEGQLWNEEYEQLEKLVAQKTANIQQVSRLAEIEEERQEWLKIAKAEVEQAQLALNAFIGWWVERKPELLGAEDLIYSLEHNICGTFDGLIKLDGKVILCDWKTSNASASKEACMPEGIGYSYFIQSAIYAMAWAEMGRGMVDDLMIVSCRKDGGFTTITASELGLSVEDCISWAKAVIICYRLAEKTKAGLVAHAEKEQE